MVSNTNYIIVPLGCGKYQHDKRKVVFKFKIRHNTFVSNRLKLWNYFVLVAFYFGFPLAPGLHHFLFVYLFVSWNFRFVKFQRPQLILCLILLGTKYFALIYILGMPLDLDSQRYWNTWYLLVLMGTYV